MSSKKLLVMLFWLTLKSYIAYSSYIAKSKYDTDVHVQTIEDDVSKFI